MRIIAGTKKGMAILSPKTDGTRPITDRIKESLFNVLRNYGYPQDKIVADLFCGTGSMGLESLSRGAKFCLFAEYDQRVVDILRKNIQKGCFDEVSRIARANAFKIGAPEIDNIGSCELVFVDPPYRLSKDAATASMLGKMLCLISKQTPPNSLVVVRTDERTDLMEKYENLEIFDKRNWGTMNISIFKNQKSSEENP
jgi:16S rRNA (guanine966-N2)-methyltransferase